MREDRFERQERFFGKDGQIRLRQAHIAVVGIGGLGTFVVHELASLGVGRLTHVDDEFTSETNRNRYLCLWHTDKAGSLHKVDLANRIATSIDPSIKLAEVRDSIISQKGLAAIQRADYVVGCVDSAAARLFLVEACAAYSKPYFDLASDVVPGPPLSYGGHVICMNGMGGCPLCYGELDVHEALEELESVEERKSRDSIYGIPTTNLDRSGPSVIAINGVIASAAVLELMTMIVGLRAPVGCIRYYGESAKMTVRARPKPQDCFYCGTAWGKGDAMELNRYFRMKIA